MNHATAAAANDDDINNAKLNPKCRNLIGDLDGIHEYLTAAYNNLNECVNTYNSTTDKTKLIILETHLVNNNNDDGLNTDIRQNQSQVKRNSDDDAKF